MRHLLSMFLGVCLAILLEGSSWAQGGRVFRSTPETIAIWEMNDLPVGIGEPLPDGTAIPDLSGNGFDAVVEANQAGAVGAMEGDPNFGGNTACGRVGGDLGVARVVVNNDQNAFEFAEDEDFSIELYVRRAEVVGGENWGILAGTWHSRTLLNDTDDPIAQGAWYGYGFIRHNEGGGWLWNCSPINADGTFTPSFNELGSARFEIEAGSHYVVASVDRQVDNLVTIYLDGIFVGAVGLPAGRAFIKPTGYEHARFMFLTGEDDSTRNAYRPAPTGYAIDAARVQRRTISAEEVLQNWELIQLGKAVPDIPDAPIQAVVSASSRNVAVGQCVLLSGANSSPGPGATITRYDWKVGGGDFVQGNLTHEVSFNAPSGPAGIEVTLRVTDSANNTATASLVIVVTHLRPAARIETRRGTDNLGASPIIRVGDVLTLDASASSTPVPSNAFVCPITDNTLLPEPLITEYRWDVRDDGSVDDTRVAFDLPAPTAGKFPVRLTVVNASGAEDSRTIEVEVVQVPDVEPAPAGRIFLPTPETIAIWEMNDLPVAIGEPLPDGTVIPDLSGNGLQAVVEANESGVVVAGEGDPLFDVNTSCGKIAFNNSARIVVNDDGNNFEMNEVQDFSIELYVRRAEVVGGENWGILAGTWHSRTLLDDAGSPDQEGAWYGYGFIRHNEGGGWRFVCSPINPDGTFNPSFNEVLTGNFEIPAGSHYVVATVDRVTQSARAYLDGVQVGSVNLPPGRALITPTDYEHARFMFLTGEDDGTRNAYRPAPAGYSIDAARVMVRVLSPQEIRDNYTLLRVGVAVPPTPRVGPSAPTGLTATAGNGRVDLDWNDNPEAGLAGYHVYRGPEGGPLVKITTAPVATSAHADTGLGNGTRYCYQVTAVGAGGESGRSGTACATPVGGKLFRRGDLNSDQRINLTDAINFLSAQFLGEPELITCKDAADVDDTGNTNLTDAIFLLSFLFQGGDDPPAPGPRLCGVDATPDMVAGVERELGCLSDVTCVDQP